MRYSYDFFLNRILQGGGTILEARQNYFIVWLARDGYTLRADYFDCDGIFEGRQLLRGHR